MVHCLCFTFLFQINFLLVRLLFFGIFLHFLFGLAFLSCPWVEARTIICSSVFCLGCDMVATYIIGKVPVM